MAVRARVATLQDKLSRRASFTEVFVSLSVSPSFVITADHEQKHAPTEADPCKALVANRPMTEGAQLSKRRTADQMPLLANFGKEVKPEPIIAKISEETLAEMIGTTRSRVSFFHEQISKTRLHCVTTSRS